MEEKDNQKLGKFFLERKEFEIINHITKVVITKKRGLLSLEKFLNVEIDFWKDIKKESTILSNFKYYLNSVKQMVDNVITRINPDQLLENRQLENDISNIQNSLNSPINQHNKYGTIQYIVYSTMPEGQFLKKLYQLSPDQGDAACLYLFNNPIQQGYLNNPPFLTGIIKAYEFVNQRDSIIVSRTNEERDLFSSLSNNWLNKTEELNDEFNLFKQNLNEWKEGFIDDNKSFHDLHKKQLDDFFSTINNQFKNLEDAYNEKLKVEAPIEYWEKIADKHKNGIIIWGLIILIFSVALISIFLNLLYEPPVIFNSDIKKLEPTAIKTLFLFGTIVAISIFLLRFNIKLILSHMHQKMDAEERRNLTYVYLALILKGAMKEEERYIVLQSLFSRVDTGLIGKDSSPTMPSNLVDSFLNISKSH